jgi:hypothetical protein
MRQHLTDFAGSSGVSRRQDTKQQQGGGELRNALHGAELILKRRLQQAKESI